MKLTKKRFIDEINEEIQSYDSMICLPQYKDFALAMQKHSKCALIEFKNHMDRKYDN